MAKFWRVIKQVLKVVGAVITLLGLSTLGEDTRKSVQAVTCIDISSDLARTLLVVVGLCLLLGLQFGGKALRYYRKKNSKLSAHFHLQGNDKLEVVLPQEGEITTVLTIGIKNEDRENLDSVSFTLLIPKSLARWQICDEDGAPIDKGRWSTTTEHDIEFAFWNVLAVNFPGRHSVLFNCQLTFDKPGIYPVTCKVIAPALKDPLIPSFQKIHVFSPSNADDPQGPLV